MRQHSLLSALLTLGLVIPLSSCNSSPGLTSIAVSPTVMNFGGAGLTTQLTAIGSYTRPNHAAVTKDITSQVTWKSSTPGCVTVNSTGLIVSGGLTCSGILVTATSPGFHGVITGTMTVNVTQPSSGGGGGGSGGTGKLRCEYNLHHSDQPIGSISGSNRTVSRRRDNNVRNYSRPDQTGCLDFEQYSDRHDKLIGSGHGREQGTVTITALYTNADNSTATGTATFTVMGGASQQFTALSLTPGSQSLSASGQTGQFIALGTSGSDGLIQDVTDSPLVKWTSSIPSIATVSSTGLAQGVSAGSTTITAELTNSDGSVVTADASVAVTLTSAPEPLLSLTIIPSSISVAKLAGDGAIPGDWNVLDCPNRQGSHQHCDVALFHSQRLPGRHKQQRLTRQVERWRCERLRKWGCGDYRRSRRARWVSPDCYGNIYLPLGSARSHDPPTHSRFVLSGIRGNGAALYSDRV